MSADLTIKIGVTIGSLLVAVGTSGWPKKTPFIVLTIIGVSLSLLEVFRSTEGSPILEYPIALGNTAVQKVGLIYESAPSPNPPSVPDQVHWFDSSKSTLFKPAYGSLPHSFEIQMRGRVLLLQTTVFGGWLRGGVKVWDNQPMDRGYDFNADSNALEIVDSKRRPLLQVWRAHTNLFYLRMIQPDISVTSAALAPPYSVMVISTNHSFRSYGELPSWSRIFEYPSSQYPGERMNYGDPQLVIFARNSGRWLAAHAWQLTTVVFFTCAVWLFVSTFTITRRTTGK